MRERSSNLTIPEKSRKNLRIFDRKSENAKLVELLRSSEDEESSASESLRHRTERVPSLRKKNHLTDKETDEALKDLRM